MVEFFLISRPFNKKNTKIFCVRTCFYGGITLFNCVKTVDLNVTQTKELLQYNETKFNTELYRKLDGFFHFKLPIT